MFKKVILSAASAGALALAMGAYADNATATNSGFYVGGQAGYAYDGNSSSAKIGPYTLYAPNGVVVTHAVDSLNKFAGFDGRIDAGYRFNPYFGLELGGTYLPQVTDKLVGYIGTNPVSQKFTLQNYAVDLMAMGYVPINSTFYAYAGLGTALVITHGKSSGNAFQQMGLAAPGSHTSSQFEAKLAGGLGYKVTQNMAVTAGYSRILDTKYLKDGINEFTTGIQYSF